MHPVRLLICSRVYCLSAELQQTCKNYNCWQCRIHQNKLRFLMKAWHWGVWIKQGQQRWPLFSFECHHMLIINWLYLHHLNLKWIYWICYMAMFLENICVIFNSKHQNGCLDVSALWKDIILVTPKHIFNIVGILREEFTLWYFWHEMVNKPVIFHLQHCTNLQPGPTSQLVRNVIQMWPADNDWYYWGSFKRPKISACLLVAVILGQVVCWCRAGGEDSQVWCGGKRRMWNMEL